ncbi:Clp protease ClpB [Escherichia coli]|nr:Clp protease ClpB [Escherichia coli]
MDTPVSRSALYGKLTKSLFRSLESATTFCKLRANPYVELDLPLYFQTSVIT